MARFPNFPSQRSVSLPIRLLPGNTASQTRTDRLHGSGPASSSLREARQLPDTSPFRRTGSRYIEVQKAVRHKTGLGADASQNKKRLKSLPWWCLSAGSSCSSKIGMAHQGPRLGSVWPWCKTNDDFDQGSASAEPELA